MNMNMNMESKFIMLLLLLSKILHSLQVSEPRLKKLGRFKTTQVSYRRSKNECVETSQSLIYLEASERRFWM